jgi:(+)-trans-carveol dehydrogenase
MIEQGGGSIIMTSSVAGIRPMRGLYSYSAAKHGVIGLMHALAADLGQHWIRVNAVCPGNTFTTMLDNPGIWEAFAGGKKGATKEDGRFAAESFHLLPVPWAMPDAISNAVLFLASDEAKHITGITVPVDSGMSHQPPGTPLTVSTRLAELENAVGG